MFGTLSRVALRQSLTVRGTVGIRVVATRSFLTKSDSASKGFFSNLWSSLEGKAEEKKKESEKVNERKWLESLANKERFDFNTFAEMTYELLNESGVNGWRGKIPGFKKLAKSEEAEKILDIVKYMTEEERTFQKTITIREAKKISVNSGFKTDDVMDFNNNVRSMRTVHSWLRRRQNEGLPPPKDYEEMQVQMATDTRGLPAPVPRWRIAMLKKHQAKIEALNRKRLRRKEAYFNN